MGRGQGPPGSAPLRPIYNRYYDPLWAAAQEMDVAVSFHGNHAAYAEDLARRYLDNLVLTRAVNLSR